MRSYMIVALMTERPRVLLVDDQVAVARALAGALGDAADAVVSSSGMEAMELLRRGERFDLVVSDVMMPGMTGSELFQRARALDPSIVRRFVFLSGAVDDEEQERIAATGARLLKKPASVAGIRALLGLR